jgi:phosphoribosylglycinamide formyltransferase-1
VVEGERPEVALPAPAAPAGALRVVVLLSGAGTLLQALLDAQDAPGATGAPAPGAGGAPAGRPFTVAAVGSDRPGAAGLERARRRGVPTFAVPPGEHADRAAWDAALADAVAAHEPDLVVLAGFMRLVGPAVLARFGGRTLNSHPSLLPAFPGARAVRDALAHGARVTGATVILVDEGVDTGPVVAQRAVEVLDGDDEATLHERIKVVERAMLVDVVSRTAAGAWSPGGRKVVLP